MGAVVKEIGGAKVGASGVGGGVGATVNGAKVGSTGVGGGVGGGMGVDMGAVGKTLGAKVGPVVDWEVDRMVGGRVPASVEGDWETGGGPVGDFVGWPVLSLSSLLLFLDPLDFEPVIRSLLFFNDFSSFNDFNDFSSFPLFETFFVGTEVGTEVGAEVAMETAGAKVLKLCLLGLFRRFFCCFKDEGAVVGGIVGTSLLLAEIVGWGVEIVGRLVTGDWIRETVLFLSCLDCFSDLL